MIATAGTDVDSRRRAAFEATNLLTVGAAMVAAAAARTESRGCHRRTDCPDPRDEWRLHLDVTLGADEANRCSSDATPRRR